MRRTLMAGLVALTFALGGVAIAQQPAECSTQPEMTTVTGCLKAGTNTGQFVLVLGDGKPYQATRPLFADWGRARCGSPLEDVSSGLHSLGVWEPEARRRHDTLLRRHFERSGLTDALSRNVRDACWLASASNALAGALDYHLWAMSRPAATARQYDSAARAARDWLRIIRRADEVWRMGTGVRRGRRDAHDRRTRAPLATPSIATTRPS